MYTLQGLQKKVKHMQDQSQQWAARVIYWQSGATLLLTLMGGIFVSLPCAYSACLGGLITIISNLIFKYFAFAHYGARAARRTLRDFYLGSLLKLITMALLFALVLTYVAVNNAAFMLSFSGTHLLSILIPFILCRNLYEPAR